MSSRPQLETDQRPDTLGVIARSAFVLLQQRRHFAGARPAALAASRVEKDLARPADHPLVKPSPQRNAEAALRAVQDLRRHPRSDYFAKQPLERHAAAVSACGLQGREF